ncbi:NAD-dependent epimerase/dehydratase family protein [Pseudonocardia sp. TRM90224]|uniref:NAD-dependent epimerase/dehydratase family protein n=1 Tax=Pseudonocardia sp. TRM90224 TaxID=2812678 RepID=UPI001E5A1386|nr:NAD(P)-dependent oxidoreductase [Pseudonocardia sp. TRM90224]
MRIAVTGAAGRLGRTVVAAALREGHEIIAVDQAGRSRPAQQGVEWRHADLVDLDAMRAALADAEAVAHLGALVHPRHPEPLVHRTNVEGTYNTLVAAQEHGVRAFCFASSINAIGGAFSERARYDFFPVDEEHPSYCEDAYSLSKWVGEQQCAAFARRMPGVPFVSLRLHLLVGDAAGGRLGEDELEGRHRDLWGWTSFESAARAVLLALTRGRAGHAAYFVVAPETGAEVDSAELAKRWYPDVPFRADPTARSSFYSTNKIEAELGWTH